MNITPFEIKKSPLQSPLYPISEFPDAFDSKPEAKAFKKFFELLENDHSPNKMKHQQLIHEKLKVKVPLMKNIEELKKLYTKAFLHGKKFIILFPSKILTCVKNRKRVRGNDLSKNQRWKNEVLIPFVWTIAEYSFLNKIQPESFIDNDWKYIASLFPSVTPELCQYKWQVIQKFTPQKQEWSNEEDILLCQLVELQCKEYKNDRSVKWSKIAKDLNSNKTGNICIRLGKHCRERWVNNLNPELSKKEWTLEEDLLLLELIAENGRKWSSFAKILKGRNEHSVKNRYLSILRYLKKNGMKVNPNNFQEILASFKATKIELGSPTKKIKLDSRESRNFPPLQIPKKMDEIQESPKFSNYFESLPHSPNGISEISPLSVRSHNSAKSHISTKSQLNSKPKDSQTKPIFSLTSFQIPNIYTKCFDPEEENLISSQNQNFDLQLKKYNSIDIENLSQKLSSMSISDQMLMEANRILTDLSINSNLMKSLSISNLAEIQISHSTEKSLNILNPVGENTFQILKEEEKKGKFFVPSVHEKNSGYDISWQKFFPDRNLRSKCRTQKIEIYGGVQEKQTMEPLVPHKKKSQTLQENYFDLDNLKH